MTDKPISFIAPMIRALLDGRKVQERRILKLPQDYSHAIVSKRGLDGPRYIHITPANDYVSGKQAPKTHATGDRLWVQETWQAHSWAADCVTIRYRAETKTKGFTDQIEQIPYPDGNKNAFKFVACKGPNYWRSSTQMPRWASRLTLTVTDVRVQRLQDISEADGKDEGVELFGDATWKNYETDGLTHVVLNCRRSFQSLWNSINGPDAWDQNPWVAAYTFDVHRCNIDQMEQAPC